MSVHEYLCDQWVDRNQILSEASLGWGKAAIGFGPDWIRTLISMATESSHRVIMEKTRVGKILTARDFPCGKSWDFPGWEIHPKLEKLGNTITGKYFIKKIYYIFSFIFFSLKRIF